MRTLVVWASHAKKNGAEMAIDHTITIEIVKIGVAGTENAAIENGNGTFHLRTNDRRIHKIARCGHLQSNCCQTDIAWGCALGDGVVFEFLPF